jgi:methionyl aminopeptidase
MREAGRVVAATIQELVRNIRPGIKTKELDDIAYKEIRRHGAKPSFKGYLGFPASICVSINEEIVHGIPGSRIIKEGDIVSLDVGAIVEGFHGDSAVTVSIGEITLEIDHLIQDTEEALRKGIQFAKAGNRIGDISSAIQTFVEAKGYSIVREYVGHGIGRALHEDPQVPNYGNPNKGLMLYEGMTIAIEPMVNIGGWETQKLNDNWTVITADGSLSAHFEHTILITKGHAEILTAL